MNEIRLEDLAETIFEHMMESFKDLTPSEEKLVYECACDEAVNQINGPYRLIDGHHRTVMAI